MNDSPATQPDPGSEAASYLRLRASDADRERVAAVVNTAFAEGRLTPVEFDERLAEVFAATTYGELIPTLRDLPVPPGTLTVPPTAAPVTLRKESAIVASIGGLTVSPGATPDSGTNAVAIFADFTREGSWTVPSEMTAVAVFGSGKLDFTQATLTTDETVITAVAIFGEVKITVPPGVRIRNEMVPVLGEADVRVASEAGSGPLIVLKGAAILGTVQVRHPKPPKKSKRRQLR